MGRPDKNLGLIDHPGAQRSRDMHRVIVAKDEIALDVADLRAPDDQRDPGRHEELRDRGEVALQVLLDLGRDLHLLVAGVVGRAIGLGEAGGGAGAGAPPLMNCRTHFLSATVLPHHKSSGIKKQYTIPSVAR